MEVNEMESFLNRNGLGHMSESLIGDGVTLDLLLQCKESELMLLTKSAIDKIKLRIAIDKLRVQDSQQSPTGSKSSSELYVSTPVRETTTLVEPITNNQYSQQSPTGSKSSSDLHVSLPAQEKTTPVEPKTNNQEISTKTLKESTGVSLYTSKTSSQKLASTAELTSRPELISTPELTATPELTSTSELTSTPELTATPELTSTRELTLTRELTSTPELISTPELTSTPKSTPECTSTASLPGPSNSYVLSGDTLLELNEEDFTFLKNIDLSNLGKETGKSLQQLLSSVTFGRVLLDKASKGEKLNHRDRAFIGKLVVEAELRSLHDISNSIRKEIWENWANEVVFLFKGESKEIYYIPYHVVGGKVIQASGLFHNRLITHRRLLATSTKKRKSSTGSGSSDSGIEFKIKRTRPLPESFKTLSDTNTTTESCLDWLRSSSSPRDLVVAKWVTTFELRNEILSRSLSHEEYFKTFPALTLPNGHELLTQDFQTVYPTADRVFDERFPLIKTRILNLLAEKGGSARVDESTLELLTLASVGEEQASLAAILAIPNLLRQMPTISVPRKKTWKLSREEVRTSFLGRVATVSDIERFCADREAYVAAKGIPEQPYILAVGPSWDKVTQYETVIFKGQRYQFDNICSAIKITYHIYWALDSAYSKDSAVCWMFVQRAFFNMKSKFDTEGVPLRELLHKVSD